MKNQFRKGFMQKSNKGTHFVQVIKIGTNKVMLKTAIKRG